MFRHILVILLLLQSIIYAGFKPDTLIKTQDGFMSLNELQVGHHIQCCINNHNNLVTNKRTINTDSYIEINIEGLHKPLITSIKQQFYLPEKAKWKPAYKLKIGDKLL